MALAASLLSLVSHGTLSRAAEPQTITIGAILPLSGLNAGPAVYAVAGYDMAAADINAAGGIKGLNGATIKLIYGDSQGQPAKAAQLAVRMVQEDHVVALTGSFTSPTGLAISSEAESLKVPYLQASGLANSLTERGMKYTFRNKYTTIQGAAAGLEFLQFLSNAERPIKKVALLWENSAYGTEGAEADRLLVPKYHFQMVADVSFKTGTPDLSSQLLQIRNSHADAILGWYFAQDTVVLLKEMNTLQMHLPYIVPGSGVLDSSIQELGPVSEGVFGITHWNSDLATPGSVSVSDRFEQKYHKAPNDNTADAYSALWILADALNAARSTDPATLRDAIAHLRVRSGPALITSSKNNEIFFGPKGQSPSPELLVVQLQHGRYRTVWPKRFAKAAIERSWLK